jgi:hypothetical protein
MTFLAFWQTGETGRHLELLCFWWRVLRLIFSVICPPVDKSYEKLREFQRILRASGKKIRDALLDTFSEERDVTSDRARKGCEDDAAASNV